MNLGFVGTSVVGSGSIGFLGANQVLTATAGGGGGGGGGGASNSLRSFPVVNTIRLFPINSARSFPVS